jgi:hypothetical protein
LEVAHIAERRVADGLADAAAARGARHWRSLERVDSHREFHEALLDADSFEDLHGQVAGGDPEG